MEMYTRKRFQWQMENLSQELGLGPGFISISPLILIMIKGMLMQIWKSANIFVFTWK